MREAVRLLRDQPSRFVKTTPLQRTYPVNATGLRNRFARPWRPSAPKVLSSGLCFQDGARDDKATLLVESPAKQEFVGQQQVSVSGAKIRLDKPPVNLAFRIARVYATDSQEVESKDFHSFGFFTI